MKTFILAMALLLCGSLQAAEVVEGVTAALAAERAATVSDVCYELTFRVPSAKAQPVRFAETLRFLWTGREDLQIDFQGQPAQLADSISVNGTVVPTVLRHEHIVVPARLLRAGANIIFINGTSGDKALNRADDYLYTLFVPDHARSVFPCFDQPDLKARFTVTLHLPDGWTSLTNRTAHPLPTYLFSFVAGRFQRQEATVDGLTMTALYRETDSAKVAQLPTVFSQAALSVRWMERYTGLPLPFEHYGFVVLPGYQFGGMEHPGCIQFTDREIFLGTTPTPDEELRRLNLIAHETAHLWFGDLVTMRWFNDVWTKEVFANFMADKVAREQFPEVNHDLAFLRAHYPAALATDRTGGTHPIQQSLDNLNQAGLLYGNVIYHKAPVMMRQLERLIGEEPMRRGLQAYLRRHAYANATWDDLTAALDSAAPHCGVEAFSRAWVKERSLPTISCTRQADGRASLAQHDPCGRGLTWQQAFTAGMVPADGRHVTEAVGVFLAADSVVLPARTGDTVVPNLCGDGYGRFVCDAATLRLLAQMAQTEPDPVRRQAALMTLYENYLMGNCELFGTLASALAQETHPLVAATECSYLYRAVADLGERERPAAEQRLWAMARRHALPNVRQHLLRLLGDVATSAPVVDSLYAVWQTRSEPLLSDRDYTLLSYHLALMRPAEWQQILAEQRHRLKTDDERRAFDYISRACHPDGTVQLRLFEELLLAENRRVEPWARSLLSLLNDPVREPLSNRYLRPGLDALEDVQRTGDIFFPANWLGALLDGHRSPEAKAIVEQWIAAHPDLHAPLMNKLREKAWWLLR